MFEKTFNKIIFRENLKNPNLYENSKKVVKTVSLNFEKTFKNSNCKEPFSAKHTFRLIIQCEERI